MEDTYAKVWAGLIGLLFGGIVIMLIKLIWWGIGTIIGRIKDRRKGTHV